MIFNENTITKKSIVTFPRARDDAQSPADLCVGG